jgi:hypothetical protein
MLRTRVSDGSGERFLTAIERRRIGKCRRGGAEQQQ